VKYIYHGFENIGQVSPFPIVKSEEDLLDLYFIWWCGSHSESV